MTQATSATDDLTTKRPRRWLWVLLGIIVVLSIVASVIGYRNQQQWNRVLRFQRQVEESGGKCDIHVRYGTDFCRVGYSVYDSSWRNPITWPTIMATTLFPTDLPLNVDWSVAPQLELNYLVVFNPQFSDADLNEIPAATPLILLRLESPLVTNQSVAKIATFSKLYEVSTINAKLDEVGLVELAKSTELKFNPRLTTAGLRAMTEANAVHRILDFDLESTLDFRASQLKGVRSGGDCVFRGVYDEAAFVDIAKFLQKPFVAFESAELQAVSLPDIVQMTQVTQLKFTGCKLIGSLESPVTPVVADKPLELILKNTAFPPDYLQAFAGRTINIVFIGDTADDAWLDTVMHIPGVQSVKLTETRVTDECAGKYPFDHSHKGQGPLRPFAVKIEVGERRP
jgi:hypothetical protein